MTDARFRGKTMNKKVKWYVYGKTCEDIYGVPEESDVKIGPFDTEAEARREMESMDDERWISGQHVYYGTYVSSETIEG